jgi:hypothetical protein
MRPRVFPLLKLAIEVLVARVHFGLGDQFEFGVAQLAGAQDFA